MNNEINAQLILQGNNKTYLLCTHTKKKEKLMLGHIERDSFSVADPCIYSEISILFSSLIHKSAIVSIVMWYYSVLKNI